MNFSHIKKRYTLTLFFLAPFVIDVVLTAIVLSVDEALYERLAPFLLAVTQLCLLLFVLRKAKMPWDRIKAEFQIYKSKAMWMDLGVVGMGQLLFSIATTSIVTAIIFAISPSFVTTLYEFVGQMSNDWTVVIWNFIAMALLIPVIEEIVFRGFLFDRVKLRHGLWYTILATSIFFGLLHGISAIGGIVFGIVSCLLCIKYQTLWVPIFLHIINNAIAVLSGLFVTSEELSQSLVLTQASVTADLQLGLILLPISCILLYFAVKRLWPKKVMDTEEAFELQVEDIAPIS
ncbi:MAG: lysostaphin resistance A-like protein [Erysipelotrichaceae bacterium]